MKTYEDLKWHVIKKKLENLHEWTTSMSLIQFAHDYKLGLDIDVVLNFARENLDDIRKHWSGEGDVAGYPPTLIPVDIDVDASDNRVINQFARNFSQDVADTLRTWILSKEREIK